MIPLPRVLILLFGFTLAACAATARQVDSTARPSSSNRSVVVFSYTGQHGDSHAGIRLDRYDPGRGRLSRDCGFGSVDLHAPAQGAGPHELAFEIPAGVYVFDPHAGRSRPEAFVAAPGATVHLGDFAYAGALSATDPDQAISSIEAPPSGTIYTFPNTGRGFVTMIRTDHDGRDMAPAATIDVPRPLPPYCGF